MESMGMTAHWNQYKDKKVFVTGHTGFKGTWLLAILDQIGAVVKGFALKANEKSLFNELNASQLCDHVEGDILDSVHLSKEILAFQPDYIFHLAAQPLVLDSFADPIYTYQVNAIGTAHLLEAVRKLDKKCAVVIVTTDKVYLNQEKGLPFVETDPLGGLDPYSASKSCTEIITHSYIHSFFKNQTNIRLATARAGNVIGGGDFSPNRIIPDIVSALASDEKIILRNPTAIRPWQHVLDCLVGYLSLANRNYNDDVFYASHHQAWNFGPDPQDTMTVLELTQYAIELWGRGTYEIESNTTKPHEAHHLMLSSTKSESLLGWHSQWNGRESIRLTVDWYKAKHDHQLPIKLIKVQIASIL